MRLTNALRHILRHPLKQGHALPALGRFARWQIGTALLPGPVVVPFTDRAQLLVERGMHGATQNIYCGLNDFADMAFLIHFLRPEDLFLDIGANVGAYTVLASAVAGARTCAWEPGARAADALRRNLAPNRIADRVAVEEKALGAAAAQASFVANGTTAMNRMALPGETNAETVEVRTLDSYGLEPALIKMDVEGYEPEVIAGGMRTLRSPHLKAVIMENNEGVAPLERAGDKPGNPITGLRSTITELGGTMTELRSIMAEMGFTACSYDPFQRRVAPASRAADNALYLRDQTEVNRRVQSGTHFRVLGRDL